MSTSWQLDALKTIEKNIQGNAFEQKKKKPGLKFNPGLALICLQTTGPSCINNELAMISTHLSWTVSDRNQIKLNPF